MCNLSKTKRAMIILLMIPFVLVLAAPAFSDEAPVGKLTNFSGVVIIKSKGSWTDQPTMDQPVYSSDKIVTRVGEAKITFNDGFVITVGNNSNLLVKEGMEKAGPSEKTSKLTRRLRLMLGKLSFKSGESKHNRTILETPTAVCALRGTAGTLTVQWKNGELSEEGTSTFPDGSKYAGKFKEGKF